ncbi:hypothetical protein [Halomonas sp. DWK9]|uniref:hypothetical protein n=1 Tax=Halomonas sp. DWK9 TaxID=3060155 RepID=UPI00287F9EE2|nr:hypothetical protein [Halomonas sp. DWK9]
MKLNILPIGSCRVHRPFHSSYKGNVYSNVLDEIAVCYPKIGFFHSLKEIEQALLFLKRGRVFLDGYEHLREFLFRAEPARTTPYNVFDKKIISHSDLSFEIDKVDVLFIEVSSLNYFHHIESSLSLHWNPNFSINASYGDIYPEGFYSKYYPELNVEKKKLSFNDVVVILENIRKSFPDKLVVVTSHINDSASKTRVELANLLKEAVILIGRPDEMVFYDNIEVFKRFGYAFNGKVDVHHLSRVGEQQVGLDVQNLILKRMLHD